MTLFLFKIITWFSVLCIVFPSLVVKAYVVPAPEIKVLRPRGFEVSIPSEDGVTLFAFHGNRNEALENRAAGNWSQDVTKSVNGRFTFRDSTTKLNEGDILSYWLYVIHNGLGYLRENETFQVPTDNCEGSATQLIAGSPCSNTLIFEENFDTLDLSKWRVEQRFMSPPDFEFCIYMNRSDTISIDKGVLTLQPSRLDNGTSLGSLNFGPECTAEMYREGCKPSNDMIKLTPPVASAQISTLNSFSFIYGRVVVRAKLPNEKWLYPQIWLQSTDQVYGSNDYESGQIRMAHLIWGEILLVGALLNTMQPIRQWDNRRNSETINDGFHVFTLQWTPYNITMAVDDVIVNSFQPARTYNESNSRLGMAPFNSPFHIVLGVGIGDSGHFPYQSHSPGATPWRNDYRSAMTTFWNDVKDNTGFLNRNPTLQVDYVRVYSL